jgi:hypothetical protein
VEQKTGTRVATLTDQQIEQLVKGGDFLEICHDERDQVQK